MRRFFGDMNPTLRGFLVIALIAAVIVALSLEQTLTSLFIIARVAFFLAIAFFVYLVWRERRSDIATWSTRSRTVFYGAALLIVADFAVAFARGGGSLFGGLAGLDALAFFAVLAAAGFAMYRVWRAERHYAH